MSFPDPSLRPPEQVRFFTRHYHLLKGLCYAPAGILMLIAVGGTVLFRPQWASGTGTLGLLALGAVLVTIPWMWYQHRRYEAAYGRVRQSGHTGGGRALGEETLSFWVFGPLLLFGLCWLALAHVYIPNHTAVTDPRFPIIMTGWVLLLGVLQAPFRRLRWGYGGAGGLLFLVTLLPLVTDTVVLVQALNYGLLGAVVAGAGLYHHRLLVDTLGPPAAGEGSDE
jgi:hypothetical protein